MTAVVTMVTNFPPAKVGQPYNAKLGSCSEGNPQWEIPYVVANDGVLGSHQVNRMINQFTGDNEGYFSCIPRLPGRYLLDGVVRLTSLGQPDYFFTVDITVQAAPSVVTPPPTTAPAVQVKTVHDEIRYATGMLHRILVAHSIQPTAITWTFHDRGNLPANAALSVDQNGQVYLSVTFATEQVYSFILSADAAGYQGSDYAFWITCSNEPLPAMTINWATFADLPRPATGGLQLDLGQITFPTNVTPSVTLANLGNLPSPSSLQALSQDDELFHLLLLTPAIGNGIYNCTIRVSCGSSYQTVERRVQFSVVEPPPATLLYTLNILPEAVVDVPYLAMLGTVTNPAEGAIWSLQSQGDLPAGAAVSSNGILMATFPSAGVYNTGLARITASGYASEDIPIALSVVATVTPPERLAVLWATLPPAVINVAYTQVLGEVCGGVTGVTWTLRVRGYLPEAATLNINTGALSATFTSAAVIEFDVTVSKAGYAALDHHIRLVVANTANVTPPDPPPPDRPTEPSGGQGAMVIRRRMEDTNKDGQLLPSTDALSRVEYLSGILTLNPLDGFAKNTWGDPKTYGTGEWTTEIGAESLPSNTLFTVRYLQETESAREYTETAPAQVIRIELTPYSANTIVPNSVRFMLGSTIYQDNEGVLIMNPDGNGAGEEAGTINYHTGQALLTLWEGGETPTLTLTSMALMRGQFPETAFSFRTQLSPLRPTAFQVAVTALDGELLTGSADVNGVIAGNAIAGTLDAEFGMADLRFGEYVDDDELTPEEKAEEWYDADDVLENGTIWKPRQVIPSTARYNAVAYSILPLSADLLGLDPVRLPSDGRVPCLQVGDMVVVQHHTDVVVQAPQAGGTVNTGLTGVARARVYDSLGAAVPPSRYSLAQDTGIVTWANPLDLSGYTAPYTVTAWIEDAALVTQADISGQLTLNRTLTHTYPEGALVASAYVFGDLFAQVTTPFAQQAWTSVWSDERIGNPLLAQYNSLLYPLQLNNASSWGERWLLLFTSTTSFRVIGETLGDITDQLGGSGFHDIDHDLAPVNPITSTPYFTLPWQGWGNGWVAGNCLRFNTLTPANFPLWLAQTVHPSAPTEGQDQFRLLLRGGIDA